MRDTKVHGSRSLSHPALPAMHMYSFAGVPARRASGRAGEPVAAANSLRATTVATASAVRTAAAAKQRKSEFPVDQRRRHRRRRCAALERPLSLALLSTVSRPNILPSFHLTSFISHLLPPHPPHPLYDLISHADNNLRGGRQAGWHADLSLRR